MTKATKPIARKSQRTARPTTRKPSRAGTPVPRTRRPEQHKEPGAFGRPTRATVAARTELRDSLMAGGLGRIDALMMASKLLAAAVQEARAFLGPPSMTMALAVIGTVPESVIGEDLTAKVESILMSVAECEL